VPIVVQIRPTQRKQQKSQKVILLNNKQTFQNAKLTLKSRTGARGGYNQKHANHQTKKSSATV